MKRLTSEESMKRAEKIRRMYRTGKYDFCALASKFGITGVYVKGIVEGKKCKALTKPAGNWKDIKILSSRFAISDDGRVWSYARNCLKDTNKGTGYRRFKVEDKATGEVQHERVHRLVLTLFDRPSKKGEICRHLDDDKTNNHISNLAWGTEQDNADDGKRNGVFAKGERVFTSKLTTKIVKKFAKGYKTGSMKAYCRQFIEDHDLDISVKQLLLILKGVYWSDVTGIKEYENKYVQKLDEKAVRYFHKKWQKRDPSKTQKLFCEEMAEFLKTKGYDVSWRTIRKALNGYSFKTIFNEFNM